MRKFLTPLFEKIASKLGPVLAFLPMVADALKKDLADGDVVKVAAHAKELREAGLKMIELADYADECIVDGAISLSEAAGGALLIEALADELEDVLTGIDEDDEPETATG